MAGVVALDLPGGAAFVDVVRRVWERGDAIFPLDRRLPDPARRRLFHAIRPTAIVDETGERRLDGEPTEPGDALVIATSGTSGEPKGVVHTHDALAASARVTSDRLGITPADHWLACLPLAHIGGFTVVTKALFGGTSLTVLPAFDAHAVEDAARRGATVVSLVATALQRIDATVFRRIVLGGSRPPATLPPNVVTTYGSTETGSGVVYDGVPLDGVEIDLAPDGEILVRGPMLLREYRDGRDPRDVDGWLHTDDAGEWRDGRLAVHGRRGDLIITGGENVWPDAVERVLATHGGVAEVAVVGAPDPEWGARVVAVVVPEDPEDPPRLEALRDHVRAELPGFMAPRELRIVAALPRTSLGKVARSRLTQSHLAREGEH